MRLSTFKSVGVNKLQVAILARSSRDMSQTVRIPIESISCQEFASQIGLHSKNKWCSEGPYGVLHVVPNTGPYSVLQVTPIEGASKDPHDTVL